MTLHADVAAPHARSQPNEHPNQFALLRQRRFAPFFWTQFLGAGNDNLFKFAFTVMVTYQLQRRRWLPPAAGRAGDRRAVHPAVPAVLGHQRPAHRQVRQDARDPLRQEPRDRDHAARRVGLLDADVVRAARLRLPDGPALDAVRPGQVRLPAAAPGRARADRRQRHGRDGHLRRHPARPGRRRPAGRHPRRRARTTWRSPASASRCSAAPWRSACRPRRRPTRACGSTGIRSARPGAT